jgi:hypothetical protein
LEPFDIALKGLSKAQMMSMARSFEKKVPVKRTETKDDLAAYLRGTLNPRQKATALCTFMLAGRHSMSLFRCAELKGDVSLEIDFKRATAKPQVIYCGTTGEVIEGQQLIMWAMLDGTCTYLNSALTIRSEPEATIISSFYDPTAKALQIRANQVGSEKIRRAFASLNDLSPESSIVRLRIRDRVEMEKFAALLKGRIVKCRGRRTQPRGFDVVSGENEDDIDLRGQPDYTAHVAATDPIQEDLCFDFSGASVKLGIAFEAGSVVFRTGATEEIIQFVYGCLKQHFKL